MTRIILLYKYMSWFKQISVKDYENLIKNKNKMYNITPQFSSIELLNKYRDKDDIINKKIEIDEKLNKQKENLSKAIDKNLSEYLEKKTNVTEYNVMYSFENNDDILQSFTDVFNKYGLTYRPRNNDSSVSSRYFLRKIQSSDKVPLNLYNFFENKLKNKRKLNLRFRKHNDKLVLNDNILTRRR